MIERLGWRREWVIDWEWVRDAYEQGTTVKELAERYGISDHIVRRNLNRLGAVASRRGRPPGRPTRTLYRGRFTECDWTDAIARFYRGETLRSIAESVGCSHETVRIELRRRGVRTGQEAR